MFTMSSSGLKDFRKAPLNQPFKVFQDGVRSSEVARLERELARIGAEILSEPVPKVLLDVLHGHR